MKEHPFEAGVRWSSAAGTANYRAYSRDHEVVAAAKPDIPTSSAPAYRGDATRFSPEELLVAALASCHMLWYLHLCSVRGIVVTEYADDVNQSFECRRVAVQCRGKVCVHPKRESASA